MRDGVVLNDQEIELELSIVMPCLNEAETLGNCIRKAQNFLNTFNIRGEIVIGDNGSVDGSADIALKLGARVVLVPARGYGAACFYASQASRGTYIVLGDSDESYDFEDLMPFLEKMRSGSELVIGNRFRGGIKKGAMPWKNRHIGNPLLTGAGRLLFSTKIGDFHCGLRGYSRAAFEKMELRSVGMEFASEMIVRSQLHGLSIDEVPTTLSPDGRSRRSHLRPWRDGLRHLWLMIYLKLHSIIRNFVHRKKYVQSNAARPTF